MQIYLASPTDVAGFRAESTRMLAGQVAPDEVDWHAAALPDLIGHVSSSDSRPAGGRTSATAIVPRSFVRLTELVVLHRDEQRFALLYRLLWRLVHEPRLRGGGPDPDMQHALSMAHAVRRDIYKMKAGLQFRTIGTLEGEPLAFAWWEPVHHITEEVGSWLVEQRGDTTWFVATPDRCLLHLRGRLLCAPCVAADCKPAADDDAAWLELARRLVVPDSR